MEERVGGSIGLSVSPLWLVPIGLRFLWGLLLRFFGYSTSNTSKYVAIIVLWFMTPLSALILVALGLK